MSRYTKEDIFRIVEEEDVEFIRLQVYGYFRNIKECSNYIQSAGESIE